MSKTKKEDFGRFSRSLLKKKYGANYKVITEKDYINVVKTSKKENVTPNNIGEIMLSQIPGISANVAKCVINHFNCIVNLFFFLRLNYFFIFF